MRLFVSVDLPDELADAVAGLQDEFADAAGLNFVEPAQAHVTLKFLGDVEASRESELAGALDSAVETAGVDPFDAAFAGLGVFPTLDYISVVWLGVEEGSAELEALHEAIEQEFVDDRGFDPEDHEFTPHVTLARMEHAGGKELVQNVVESNHPDVATMRVTEVCLTESHLTSEGPEYETRHAVEL